MALVSTIDIDARYEDGNVARGAKYIIVPGGDVITNPRAMYTDTSGTQEHEGGHVTPRGRVFTRLNPPGSNTPPTSSEIVWVRVVNGALVEHSRTPIEGNDCHLTGEWETLEPLQDGWTNEPADPVRYTRTPEGLVVMTGKLVTPTDPTDYTSGAAMFTMDGTLIPHAHRFAIAYTTTGFDGFMRITSAGSIILAGAGPPQANKAVFFDGVMWSPLQV